MDTPQGPRDDDRNEDRPEAPEAGVGARPTEAGGTNRVLDAGTSEELIIINYADDALHNAVRARREARGTGEEFGDRELQLDDGIEPAADRATAEAARDVAERVLELADSEGPGEPVPPSEAADSSRSTPRKADGQPVAGEPANPDASLIIVRDAAFVMMDLEQEARTVRPPVVPPPVPRPPIPPAGVPEATTPPPSRPSAASMRAPDAPRENPAPAPAEKGPRFIEPGAFDPGARRHMTPRRGSTSTMAVPPASSGGGVVADLPAPAAPPQPRERATSGITREVTIWSRAPKLSWLLLFVGLAAFAGATALSVLHVEPFHTWYYLFAWYPFLLVVNHLTAMRAGELSIVSGRTTKLAALAAWSVPVWLVFEAFNFRLQDWYYVGVPDGWLARRAGVILSFATVLPGIFLLEELLLHRGVFRYTRSKRFALDDKRSRLLFRIGIACTAVVLALPTFFFPLLWIVPVLLLEPWLARRGGPSLLADLADGKPGRMFRLLIAGMICGLFWETANSLAGGRWIYTVPGMPTGKLFEMPVLGFLGFPPFALACFSMARALVQVGLLPEWEVTRPRKARAEKLAAEKAAAQAAATAQEATTATQPATTPPVEGEAPPESASPEPVAVGPPSVARLSLLAWAVLASFLMLEGMDRWTVDSRTPRPENVPGIPDGVAQYAHGHGKHDVRGLLEIIDAGALHVPGASSEAEIQALRERCRLVMLRDIGTANARRLGAVGVNSVADLASRDPVALAKALRGVEAGWWPRARRVRVWVDAAKDAVR